MDSGDVHSTHLRLLSFIYYYYDFTNFRVFVFQQCPLTKAQVLNETAQKAVPVTTGRTYPDPLDWENC